MGCGTVDLGALRRTTLRVVTRAATNPRLVVTRAATNPRLVATCGHVSRLGNIGHDEALLVATGRDWEIFHDSESRATMGGKTATTN